MVVFYGVTVVPAYPACESTPVGEGPTRGDDPVYIGSWNLAAFASIHLMSLTEDSDPGAQEKTRI